MAESGLKYLFFFSVLIIFGYRHLDFMIGDLFGDSKRGRIFLFLTVVGLAVVCQILVLIVSAHGFKAH